MKRIYLLFVMLMITSIADAQVYSGQKGVIKLMGQAPQETITAESASLVGKIDISSRKFSFRQNLSSFSFSQGNLQKKHAEENFWEVDKYPYAAFSGEIINDVDLAKDGTYQVTVKGTFGLHGVEREIKIPAAITVQNGTAVISARFNVFLSDYNIKVPRLVAMKVAPDFTVDVYLKTTKP